MTVPPLHDTAMRCTTLVLLVSFATLAGSCSSPAPEPELLAGRAVTVPPPAADAVVAADLPGLHNVVTYHEGLHSGAVPEGAEGFETLAAMGVRTILSVDGAAPDVEEARKHGLRYVHLPITYSGIHADRALEIARAVHDLPDPIYVHCHHGKHRSAAAAATAAVALGYLTTEAATARMKVSGTAPSYKGLYECVAESIPVDQRRLEKASAAFPEISRTSGLVDSMVEVDEIFEHIKAVEKAGWKAPTNHPDLVPSAEAGRLENLLRQLDQDRDVHAKTPEFRAWLSKAADQAKQLEDALTASPVGTQQAASSFKLLTQGCKECHNQYRD